MVEEPDQQIRAAAMAHPNFVFGQRTRPERQSGTSSEISAESLSDPARAPETLARHAAGDDPRRRAAVTGHPNTPPDVLKNMAEDPDTAAVLSLAENPNTPPDVLDALSIHPHERVRWNVAFNPSTPA